jgi:hypothetical protein
MGTQTAQRRRWLAFAAALSFGCSRPPEAGGPQISEIQNRLTEREGKLSRFRVAARTERPDEPQLAFDFAYQAPGRMMGREYRPQARTVSFDGQAVYELVPAQKTLRQLRLPDLPAARALKLAQRFTPFIPEGFRTPLLPWKSVTVSMVTHPRAPAAVALRALLKDDAGQPLSVTYTLRWPSMDFLVKRLEGSGGVAELRAEEERCEGKLGVCFPLRLSQWKDGGRVGLTEILELELFEGPPAEEFTLQAPSGYVRETADL